MLYTESVEHNWVRMVTLFEKSNDFFEIRPREVEITI